MSRTHGRGRWTIDLLVVGCLTALGTAAIAVDLSWTPLRILLALPLILLLPGYALVSALFPEGARERRLGAGVRLLLGVVASVALVPMFGVLLYVSPFSITVLPLLAAVSGATIALTLLAFLRRLARPPERRFAVAGVGFGGLLGYFRVQPRSLSRPKPFEPRTGGHLLLNVLLVVSVIALLGSVGAVVGLDLGASDETFTEFYVLDENEDGELVADGYPSTLPAGESHTFHIAIGNEEGTTVDYAVVVLLQSVTTEGGETTVVEQQELDRFDAEVAAGETEVTPYEAEMTASGEDLQLTFLLYRDGTPSTPTRDNAYRSVHLGISVE